MTFWALPGCPHLYPQERWGCYHGDDLRVFIRQDLPSAREESQYKGAICPHLLLVTGPSGPSGIQSSALDMGLLVPLLTCIQECSWAALFHGHQGQPSWFLLLQGFCP